MLLMRFRTGAPRSRRASLACYRLLLGSFLLLVAASAQGQQFASLASAADDRSAAARAAGTAIIVDRDLVRSGPQRLELQGTDGRILVAERSVFEDRGDGNVMWSGRFPGANYDSVVLTVQDGHLQGMFGEPGRAAHWIRSGLDGLGSLTQHVGGGPAEFCGGGLVRDEATPSVAARSAVSDLPARTSQESNHDRLDILVLYTVQAAEVWENFGYGTPRASIQAAMDYLGLVFRNNSMPATPHLVHVAEAPAALDGPRYVLDRLTDNREVAQLRAEHQADIVHLFVGEPRQILRYCGIAWVLLRAGERNEWSNGYSVTTSSCFPDREGAYPYFGEVFAHEVGHNLGANHDPANTRIDPDRAVRPWAYGHYDISVAPTVETIMSYRSYVPRQRVPFFSSVRIQPNGWTIGQEGERENERAIYDTLPLAVRYSELMDDPSTFPEFPSYAPPLEAPANLTVEATSATSARLEWKDQSENETGFRIHARIGGDIWRVVDTVTADRESVEVTGLKREGRYTFRVRAYHDLGGTDSDLVTVVLRAGGGDPGPGPEGISVPDDLTATASGATAVELGWSGAANGTVEVEARSWKEGWRNVASTDAAAGRVTVEGLDAEAPYTFRLRLRANSGKVSSWSEEINVTTGDASGPCRPGEQYLCLSRGRFEIQAHWKDHNREGVYGLGTAVPVDVSEESGMFWFFSSSNIELVVKALDGTGVNGHYWVFFGALSDVEYWVTVRDTAGGGRRTYHNPPAENCGQSDIRAFLPAAAASSGSPAAAAGKAGVDLIAMKAVSIELPGVALAQEGAGTCEPGAGRLCLHDGRFSVEVEFTDPNVNERKVGQVVSSLTTQETGFFWFFSPTNVELAAKVLDGRALTGKYWFLYGGLSDVEYTITLTDTATGESAPYYNEAGSLCGGIDTGALPR